MSTPNGMGHDHGRSPKDWIYPTETMPPTQTHDAGHGQDTEKAGHGGHGGHGLMMMICCIPMLVIAGLLVATGVAGSGIIVTALLCTAMMAAMMFAMPGGHGGHGQK
ncbi:hypothetical protein GCM10011376_13810 [Nocardioides flavus (ex Wang et al. 2016)]|uniref:DUF2933 domain-containing protein n=1 Tax=Nocardioides flavus (ex Wang et al. 2016) TaxID=2058780 RepID=A0ABQ3HJ99_9ACTN|nr:hypothetical protein [Nocardioides flavus (ex Wang et al. 2016)]GHE16771.1 hypothetical protein GCM10011376_13810 [Nocardioides flavus (ex Wang et al. 2016)]